MKGKSLGHCLPGKRRDGFFRRVPRRSSNAPIGPRCGTAAMCAGCASACRPGSRRFCWSSSALNYLPPIGGFRLPGELGNLVIHGTKITMQQPRLTGFTVDSRAYEFSADAAAQDITKPNLVELQQLHAKMEMQDKTTVDMSANSGVYDVKSEMLTLKDNIVLISSTGYEGPLSEAVIDVRKGNVVSDEPVSVKMLDGFLNAKRLDIADNGSVLRFGGVTMTIAAEQGSATASDPAKVADDRPRRLTNDAPHQGWRWDCGIVRSGPRPPRRRRSAAAASPFQGMQGQSQDQPVQIEAATLEVRDKNKTATFSGNVQVVQGDTTMKCQSLVVFYGQEVGIGARRHAGGCRRRPPPNRRRACRKTRKTSAASKRAAASPSSPRTRMRAAILASMT